MVGFHSFLRIRNAVGIYLNVVHMEIKIMVLKIWLGLSSSSLSLNVRVTAGQ